jgi:ABC-type dipeptide/oligopeptide/nickel transport system permease component
MFAYLVQRIGEMVVVVIGVSTIVFLALRLSGDPVALLAPQDATESDRAVLRRELGLADPLPLQYARFMGQVAALDFGVSYRYQRPAAEVVLNALPTTLQLTLAALALAVAFAVPAGIIAAVRRDTWVDAGAMAVSLLGQAMPVFWLGLLLILMFSVYLRWLPTGGWGSPAQAVMPALALGAYSSARISRLVRSGMLEVLSQEYVRTARAKGLGERRVILVHALRNALIPVITVVGLEVGVLLGGAVITETIFSVPGLGRLAVTSVLARDYPIVQAAVFCAALVITLVGLAVDLAYVRIDPRIRLR